MLRIDEHVWGVSAAQDMIWAQVVGMPLKECGAKQLLVLQAFIDDSYGPDGVFVLAGYISDVANWVSFTKDWEELLPYSVKNNKGKWRFKMSEMASNSERMARVPAFYRVIERHGLIPLSFMLNINDLKRVTNKVFVVEREFSFRGFENPYLVAFYSLVGNFHTYKAKIFNNILLQDQVVDFIFDE